MKQNRKTLNFEIRAEQIEEQAESYFISGYATTVEQPYELYEISGVKYYEVVSRNAFDTADMSDVVLLYNHGGKILARTTNGTLTLTVDSKGLFIKADLSKSTAAKELFEEVKNGLITKMSFAFDVKEDSYNNETHTARIEKLNKIYDVSAVCYPANENTDIYARNKEGNKNMNFKQINERISQVKAEFEKRAEEITIEETRKLSAELDSLIKERDVFQKEREKREKILKEISEPSTHNTIIESRSFRENSGEENIYSSIQYRNAFKDFISRGKEYRSNEFTLTSDVSAVIPTPIFEKIFQKLEETGKILPLVTHTVFKGNVRVPAATVKPVATWVAEGGTSNTQKAPLTEVTFSAYKLRCAVAVSFEVENLTLAIFENYLIEAISKAMIKALESAIINGTGIGQPTGILSDILPEQTISISDEITYDDLLQAEAVLPSGYDSTAKWFMNKKTWVRVEGMTDATGQPLIRSLLSPNGKLERMILGREVILSDDIAPIQTAETDDIPAFLFDPADYVINTNYQVGIKKYEDNTTDDVVTKAIMLVDGKPIINNSIVALKVTE